MSEQWFDSLFKVSVYHICESILLSENVLMYNIYLQDSILECLAAVPSLLKLVSVIFC